jgi:hypothetical protein
MLAKSQLTRLRSQAKAAYQFRKAHRTRTDANARSLLLAVDRVHAFSMPVCIGDLKDKRLRKTSLTTKETERTTIKALSYKRRERIFCI